MKKTYAGWVYMDDYGVLCLRDSQTLRLAEAFSENHRKGDMVLVRYYVSPFELTEEQAVIALIHKIFGGFIDAEFILEAWSEWTVEELVETLTVGGHDLIQELSAYEGKYVIVVVESAEL